MVATPEQIKAALADIFGSTIKGDYTAQERMFMAANKVALNQDIVKFALRLAEKVMGEPSEGMVWEGFQAVSNRRIFKAMIAQAVKEVTKDDCKCYGCTTMRKPCQK